MNILFALLAAILLSAFQYLYKRKALSLFIFRALSYFAVLLLLVNPKVEKQIKKVTKPDLYILADNSKSIAKQNVGKSLKNAYNLLKNSKFDEKFSVHYYSFGNQLQSKDSLDFTADKTDISAVLKELKNIQNTTQNAAVILLTDGQSTLGENYTYSLNQNDKLQVFPIVVGDTTRYDDLRINLLNANPFAYKGNRFPVEIFTSYDGKKQVVTNLIIKQGKQTVYKKKLKFSATNKSQHINLMLDAKAVGNYHYTAFLTKIDNEHNTLNNQKYFSVEIIDNAKKILLLSSIIHPDLGVLKRSLSKDKYLQIDLKKPSDKSIDFKKYHSLIIYQPTSEFADVFKTIKREKISWLVISGTHTDWAFINRQKLFFSKQSASVSENYFPAQNTSFSLFKLPELSVSELTPLVDSYGNIQLQGQTQTAYYSKIKGIATHQPLFVFNSEQKQALLAGENIWKWRMQSGLLKQEAAFDQLLQQSIQYLSLDKQFDRLKLRYNKQYFQGESIEIIAQVLDKNLAFNTKAQPVLSIKVGGELQKFPMSNQGDYFQADLSNLSAGTYKFTVFDKITKLKKSGSIRILSYSLEEKNLRADIKSLQKLAQNTQGKVYDTSDISTLIDYLSKDANYPSISHITVEKLPLINYKWLLFLIVLLLGAEWFLKKLRGEL
jgi:hypothetical protein